MSSSTRPPETRLAALRLGLVALYFAFAHAAASGHDGRFAALALFDVALLVLLPGLLQRSPRAFLLLALGGAAGWRLAASPHALLPLLLVPAAILALVAWGFGRSLRRGRMPLITRIATALEGPLPPPLLDYTRRLTLAWATLLALLAAANLLLALFAVPDGVLAGCGLRAPLPLPAAWRGWGDGLTYAVLAAFLWLEFAWRQRRFPGAYRGFREFVARLARLGPAFWRSALR
jgi:uncharacterized membrane protein